MPTAKKAWTYLVIVLLALAASVNYELFVFPNQFAPSGLNGICTMVQYVTGISVGYLSLIINVPLALVVFKLVNRKLAFRSMVYVVAFSLGLVILDHVDLSAFAYATDNGTSRILGPMVAGVIQGYVYSILMKASAYSGGTDFISAIVHQRDPSKSVLGFSFTINVFVAIASYFVYGYQIEPVLLCILYSFMSSTVSDNMLKSGRSAIRFEIITEYPHEISEEIIHKLHHSATVINGRGIYKGREKSVLICVVNRSQMNAMNRIIHKYPYTFAVMSSVNEVMGNFKRLNSDGILEKSYLDSGDGKAV